MPRKQRFSFAKSHIFEEEDEDEKLLSFKVYLTQNLILFLSTNISIKIVSSRNRYIISDKLIEN